MKDRVMGELKKRLPPELLNRIDEVIVFHKLSKDEIKTIVDLLLKRLREQMALHEASIELTDDAKEMLVEKGYDPAMGARPLRRAIQRHIEDPLADFVLGASSPLARRSSSTEARLRRRGRDRDHPGRPARDMDKVRFHPRSPSPRRRRLRRARRVA
jgi:ATP-dependent Clp protease ATP-binding subunit ClpA